MIPLACGGRDAYLTPMNTTETPLFKLRTEYLPTGDQPAAIEQLASNIEAGVRDQVLLGVTGSGKTFTVAKLPTSDSPSQGKSKVSPWGAEILRAALIRSFPLSL